MNVDRFLLMLRLKVVQIKFESPKEKQELFRDASQS